MAIEYEALARIGLLCLLGVLRGGQGRVLEAKLDQQGRALGSQAEGPIFYVMMVLLFGALGVVLTLEGLVSQRG